MNKPACEPPEERQKPGTAFRINVPVFRIIVLLLVALALPITLLILGVRQWVSKPEKSMSEEVSGLRANLEAVADKNLLAPALTDERHKYTFSGSQEEMDTLKSQIEAFARSHGGASVLVEGDNPTYQRILVQIPVSQASLFESSLLKSPLRQESSGNSKNNSNIYEIVFQTP